MFRTLGKTLAVVSTLAILPLASAFAQGVPGQAPSPLMQLVPLIVVFAVMYFFMIRPQMKRQKQHQALLSQLKRGDEVVTASGIFGRIEGLTDHFITLEVAPDVRIKVLRTQVATLASSVGKTAGEVRA